LKGPSLLGWTVVGIAAGLLALSRPADSDETPGISSPSCTDRADAVVGRRSLVAEGACWWARSPDPQNPVTCATCHDDLAAVRSWAASFPKFKPALPPDARVMTLLQANAEAVARHYRLADPRPVATAITAYLTQLGAGVPVSPGISVGQPVFAERLHELALSTARGRRVYAARCAACHEPASLAPAVGGFPRLALPGPQSIESFLESHHARGRALPWNGPAMADLLAYLVSHAAGRSLDMVRPPDASPEEAP
jgi:mono/diheme cytochrome c family protein